VKSEEKLDQSMRRAAFLDRDGVLIRTFVRDGIPHPPHALQEVEILAGVDEALGVLRERGFVLLVVTNQPDVARGRQTREAVERINDHLMKRLPLDGIYVCYHDNANQCACRKPEPGMLLAAAEERQIDLARSFMVGDRGSDIEAGAAAGCRTVLIEQPYSRCDRIKPNFKATDLLDAARKISEE
jgi:D-glycero-D-manno-heptose 1,7-bisphosphate phosphatase